MRGHGARQINPVHQATAEQGAERICIVRKYDFSHFRLRITNWPWGKVSFCHRLSFVPSNVASISASASFTQIRLEKTLRHLLNASVLVASQPGCCREIELQHPLTCGT